MCPKVSHFRNWGGSMEFPFTDLNGITYYCRHETKTPTIYARFHLNGKRYKFTTKTTDIKLASLVGNKKYDEIASGRILRKITFRDALDSFLETKKSQGKSPLTIEDYKRQGKYCLEFFNDGKMPITEIGSDLIIKLREWRRSYYLYHPRKNKTESICKEW